jgi:NADPH:quinone reductase-like Zn-dependent oxidoreductase
MKAAFYESFKGPVVITQLPDPSPGTDGVVIRVAMLDMIGRGKLAPQRLITRTIPLAQMSMGDFQHPGVTVIDSL